MSNNKMLIDATHPEETRVVVLRNGRVEEFDYESAARKLLRGNIYLAKVTRVEPALQAAFVDYGGNRHGFLAFNEIHPDYYQIPVADRQMLLDEEAAAEAEEEAAADARAEAMARRRGGEDARGGESGVAHELDEADDPEPPEDGAGTDEPRPSTFAQEVEPREATITGPPAAGATDEEVPAGDERRMAPAEGPGGSNGEISDGGEGGLQEIENGEAESVEQVGSEDALEEMAVRPRHRPRSYKIHEVIKRRQVILVQVVKEERGSKGAALTTYLSLAGRYTVLMPNTGRGGGISRKITNPQDRKRLKAIAAELEVPEGMGLIIRTAGAARTKQELKRDFEYLLRLWESVRELTLQSTAPSLVYEEGNLIKRSIRDLYNKDVEEVVVAGEEAHGEAKEFMRMLMPSHARNVLAYEEPEPLFARYQIERQLNAMFSPYVTLRSGGYLVINQTEALVAVDVNSGKSTREFSIEETALNTNAEAADEIARQLKLRDLAGLIVIDFIDMEEKRNNRSIERRLKDALRLDRARIQLGRISHFGLMEMSRQRLRTGVLEGSTSQCAHCQGTGVIRSTESVALAVLRGIEDALLANPGTPLVATTTPQVALYILNNKRAFIIDMEARHGLPIAVQGSDKMQGANFTIEKGAALPHATRRTERGAVNMDWGFEDGADAEVPADAAAAERDEDGLRRDEDGLRRDEDGLPRDEAATAGDGRAKRGGRRRRPRSSGWQERREGALEADAVDTLEGARHVSGGSDGGAAEGEEESLSTEEEARATEPRQAQGEESMARRGRRRGRRGGRRGRDRHHDGLEPGEPGSLPGTEPVSENWDTPRANAAGPVANRTESPARGAPDPGEFAAPAPEPARAGQGFRNREPRPALTDEACPLEPGNNPLPADEPRAATARQRPRREAAQSTEPRLEHVLVGRDLPAVPPPPGEAPETPKPARKGWWQRRFEGS